MTILITVLAYFFILFVFGYITSRKNNNKTFFIANKNSPWYMVAFGMIGASISGVTFVSVPGMVNKIGMTYLQTCLGFILGYIIVAFILLPIYYKLNLTTIYTYLDKRLGRSAYKTGATFFIISKMSGAAVRFYVICSILQHFVFNLYGIPFYITVTMMVTLIWLYTRRGGIGTLVWTDSFQTACMLLALILIIYNVISSLNLSIPETITAITNDNRSKIFIFDDWLSGQNFFKQFISGAFIVIVMTGLDQDMMQKNLTCRNLKEAQKDMITYSLAFVPINLLFLILGILLSILAANTNMPLPSSGDELLPMFAANGLLGTYTTIFFTIGIVAASFSSADSALTALTTSICIDIFEKDEDEKLRYKIHLYVAIIFTLFILLFGLFNSTSVIDAIYIMCSYTYGPLLGLFAFALFTNKRVKNKYVPLITIISPFLCYVIETVTRSLTTYKFGYEILLINGLITFIGLTIISTNKDINGSPFSTAMIK